MRLPLRINQNIRRLQIAMQGSPLMREMNRFGNLLHERRGGRGRQWTFTHDLREVFPLDKVHREIMLPFEITDFVDRDYVRMLQIRGGFSFGAESSHIR